MTTSETIVLEKRKNFRQFTTMDELHEDIEDEENVVLRRKAVSFDAPTNPIHEPENQINNIHQLSSIVNRSNEYPSSYQSNHLWRLDSTSVMQQAQRRSFVNRNFNASPFYRRRKSADELDKIVRSRSHLITSTITSTISSPFRRDSVIRQSWNNMWRKKDKNRTDKDKEVEGNRVGGGERPIFLDIQLPKVIDNSTSSGRSGSSSSSGSSNHGSSSSGGSQHWMDACDIMVKPEVKTITAVKEMTHSRNSSSASSVSYR